MPLPMFLSLDVREVTYTIEVKDAQTVKTDEVQQEIFF
jgi:hypothetical protein